MLRPPANGELEALLEYLHERRNFDFRGYKRASLTRRIFKRMQMINIDDYQRYMEILEANPGEFAELFNTILINVTSLMRDKDAWEALATRVDTGHRRRQGPEDSVRIWSAGCASGEEAYSSPCCSPTRWARTVPQSVKIYATDADKDALARRGRPVPESELEARSAKTPERYFESDGDTVVFRGDLRRP